VTPRRPLPPEEAEALSGEILDRAIERARVTNAEVAVAIGYAESGEKHVREMRAGTRAFTLRHFALLTVAIPRLARAIAAEMMAAVEPDSAGAPVIHAVQTAALAGAELARVGISAAMDGRIDAAETTLLRVQSRRCGEALADLDRALAKSAHDAAKRAS
jgi:hypothetical protein